jgi:hypothetical protein
MINREHRKFMAAINFAADHAGLEANLFLQMWREGCWQEIQSEFPEFKGPFPEVDLGA